MSYSAYMNQQEMDRRITDLEVTLECLIRESVNGSTNPIRRETLLGFADRVRERNARDTQPAG